MRRWRPERVDCVERDATERKLVDVDGDVSRGRSAEKVLHSVLTCHAAEHVEPADEAEEGSPRRVFCASEQAMVVAMPLVAVPLVVIVVVDVVKRKVAVVIGHEVVIVIAVEDARVSAGDAVLVIGMLLGPPAAKAQAARGRLEGVIRDETGLVNGEELHVSMAVRCVQVRRAFVAAGVGSGRPVEAELVERNLRSASDDERRRTRRYVARHLLSGWQMAALRSTRACHLQGSPGVRGRSGRRG